MHDQARDLGWTPDRITAAIRAATRTIPSTDTIDLADVLEQLSAIGSTWTRADVLQAICDLAPPVSQLSGRDWANAVEQAADRVIDACISLDPPAAGAPTRASDGRSIWLAPSEPHLTHERVLAEEERILTFAIEAYDQPASPSTTLDRVGLDVLQADAAAAVAGHDKLVLLIGPAGTGKTTTLRRAVHDLHDQHRPAFGVAPTAKAAKVLRDETGMPSDTVAKLLYEWRTRAPGDGYRLPPATTVVVDEAGMIGTGALDKLVALTVSQQWRLVLVGDPSQLQAVGRGGMFDELCNTGRAHELATIHRFHQPWEQQASLLLRAGNTEALDVYFAHGRVTAGSFDNLVADAARQWINHTDTGRTVALVAETNEHVDAINLAVQQQRRNRGHLGDHAVRVAGGETASPGDIIVTRRNDRTTRTDHDEPVRNRDHWNVIDIHLDGRLTVSHLNGHGHATLSANYARHHVRLGYAATAHGHQGDTVDIGIAVITEATNHRSLYVAATRGRQENRLLVVTDNPEQEAARDVLERVLTNDRADIPAIAQRRTLSRQVTRLSASDAVTTARRALEEVRRQAEPFLEPLQAAQAEARAAEQLVREAQRAVNETPRWRRRAVASQLRAASDESDAAQTKVEVLERNAAPYAVHVHAADQALRQAEHEASMAKIRDRFERMSLEPPSPTMERDVRIDPPGLGR